MKYLIIFFISLNCYSLTQDIIDNFGYDCSKPCIDIENKVLRQASIDGHENPTIEQKNQALTKIKEKYQSRFDALNYLKTFDCSTLSGFNKYSCILHQMKN